MDGTGAMDETGGMGRKDGKVGRMEDAESVVSEERAEIDER